MKISHNWLKSYLNIDLEPEVIAEVLTDIGLEVEGIEQFQSVNGGLEGLVVGEVKTKIKHPNADTLILATVDVAGADILNIVCGAPNVEEGQKVVVAKVGTMLYPSEGEPFKIKRSKIRGEESEGMICAEDEIGLGTEHDGIMVLKNDAKKGSSAADYFAIESDVVYEIGLTPNRIDGASHYGTARDLYAGLKYRGLINDSVKLCMPVINELDVTGNLKVDIAIKEKDACTRYAGVCIEDIKVQESPAWLKNRLKAIGLGPINNVVDATNFVLHELGQPLHAFDMDEIKGNRVIVQTVSAGTKFRTLDEVDRELTENDLMICNESAPMCIAGIFGGINSGVSEKTSKLFLESAYFNPVSVRKTAKKHGLNTDSSFRFERGVDPNMTIVALKRAANLIIELAGGKVASETIDLYESPIADHEVNFSVTNCNRITGVSIPKDEMIKIINLLDIRLLEDNNDNLKLSVPAYRVDVVREIDVIEEVLRIYGFNNVPEPEGLKSSISYKDPQRQEALQNTISNLLSSIGFVEMMSNSLTRSSSYSEDQLSEAVKILNPLSNDLDILRMSLLFGGLEAIRYNLNHKNEHLKCYEFGKVYKKVGDNYEEELQLDIFICGNKEHENWSAKEGEVGFEDIKGYVNTIVNRLGIKTHNVAEDNSGIFDFGISEQVSGKLAIKYGRVKTSVCSNFGIKVPVFYANIRWELVRSQVKSGNVKYKTVSKFPSVRRDLALLINDEIQFDKIAEVAKKTDKKLLKEVGLFDVYKGKNIGSGKKSYGVSFVFSDEHKTLTDKQVDKIMDSLIKNLQQEVAAEIR